MRIQSINIEGYGRFTNQDLEFEPGLQVVVGPNERGKSTIRSFIADMLFGQKVNDTQRVFDEANALRQPWEGNGAYGGALVYALDDGRCFEVVRSFDRHHEKVEVFDRATGEEVTNTFERFRNRELDFARQHLGLTKDVFLHTATISHMTLDELGDKEALDEIREKLLALTDTGGGSGTVDCAMRLLGERVSAIGMSGAAGKPLAKSKSRLAELEKEFREVLSQRQALSELALERKTLVERCRQLRRERQAAEAALEALERHEARDRLEAARELRDAIDGATRDCLALSHVRDVPRERDGEIHTLHQAIGLAREQLETSRSQLADLEKRLLAESGGEGGARLHGAPEFPAAIEQALNEALAARPQLEERVRETEALVQAARDRMDAVREQLVALPDFSRLAADPVEWLSQLASSFAVAQRARDEECALRDELREEVDNLKAKNATHHALFAGHEEFPELAREYTVQSRLYESQKDQYASTLHTLQGTYAELQGESRAFLPIGTGCLVVTLLMAGVHLFSDFDGLLFPSAVSGGVGLIFLAMWATQRGHMKRLRERIEEAREAVNSVSKAAGIPRLGVIDEMLREARLDSVRELEAMYDQYRNIEMELKVRREALAGQEEKAREAEERIPLLVERFQETFAKAGETITGEGDVKNAAGRAIARYQEYREAKRRATTNRSVLERHEAELTRLRNLANENEAERKRLEKEARNFIAEHGAAMVEADDSVQEAISQYRRAIAQNREALGRQDLLGENLRAIEHQIEQQTQNLAHAEAAFETALRPFNVNTIEAWEALVEEANHYHALAEKRRALESSLAELLGPDSLATLEARVAAEEVPDERPKTSREVLRETIRELNDLLEEETAQEHALHLRLTEQGNAMRALNEIEEEMAVTHRKLRSLEAEGDATSYAMALMEDVARDTHAYVAPRLAEEASGLLARITNGAYTEISLGRDLSVRVRIPETQRLQDAPEKSLSKGTVDQIYLALRLAFVQSLNANNEAVPMLLDDPFANYDDARLATTMGLISELVGRHQVILFTCREDVVTAAKRESASIIRL